MRRRYCATAATGLVGIVTLFAGFSYLTTAPEAVENFRHVGYPQQLRVLLGIGKLAGAIVLLLPRLPTLKEWAYAGFTFMWIAAIVAHYLAGDGALSLLPVALLGLLAVSYVTRPANRRGSAKRCWRSAARLRRPCYTAGRDAGMPDAVGARGNAHATDQPRVGLTVTLSVSLPPDTIAEGVRRLGWLALVYAIGNIAGPFARLVLSAVAGRVDASDFGIPDVFGLAAVIMAFAIFVAVRRGALSSKRLLDLGLVFQVVGALGIAVREFWQGLPPTAGGSFLVPGECVWLVAYPLLVPNTPRKILVASLLAASMGPAALAISAVGNGTPVGRPLDAATYFLTSSYLCAILAYVIARIVHRFNMQLKDAREIGSYELIERIGEGGMGEVWRAKHRLLARPAAIKLIRSSMLGESQRAREALVRRFEREAQETAALGSIHTIDVYDFGVTDEGDFYYVMELLDGLSLERLVQEFGPVEPARTVYLLRQVCHSLGEAHARGLVHRDIKPANIFVCRLGPDDDFVKVLDFGLVKHTAAGQTVTMLTMEGTAAGTPGYMAPEIALGIPTSTAVPTSTRWAVSPTTC